MPYFDQDYYIAQKVAQMNATGYVGRTGTAGTTWTAESAARELAAWNISWQQNFEACNGSGYSSSIKADAINVSPNALFDVNEYAQALANYNNANSVNGQTNWTASSVIDAVLNTQHQSLWNHYTTQGAALGINPSNSFDTMAWANAQAASTGQTAAQILSALAANGQNPVMAYLDGGGTVADAPAVAEDAVVTVPADFNPWAVSTPGPDVPVQPVYTNTIYLTDKLDVIPDPNDPQDMSGNDHIIGQEFDGVNTLQSGDRIDGGAGQDLLTADVTAGNTFGQILNTVRPEVHNVETIKFTSQQSTDTTHGQTAIAGIRADRIDGVNQIWDSNSRASLQVDDVRVLSNRTTIGWQDADNALNAGDNMDFVVRYNNQYLAADNAVTQSTLQLQVMDVVGAAQDQPLLENTYDGLTFTYNGAQVQLDLTPYQEMISGPTATYQTLLAAVQQAIAANPACVGLSANLGPTFEYSPKDGTPIYYQGTSIVITAADGTLAPGRWLASNGVDADSDLDTDMKPAQATTCPLLQTDIALDNVGMVNWFANPNHCIPDNQQFGDYAGDMIVGGMGEGGNPSPDNGQWSTNYVGLQRFDVTVDRGSWMSSLQSTNHALRMITVKNGDLDDTDTTVGTNAATDRGNLFIGDGQRAAQAGVAGGNLMFEGRDGMLADASLIGANASQEAVRANPQQYYVGQTVDSGIADVAVFDASAMTGKANISAAVTQLASHKYLGDTDQVDALGNRFAPGEPFRYNFGSNDDTLNMSINGNVAADNDFKMNINMGDGNNSVHTSFENSSSGSWVWVEDTSDDATTTPDDSGDTTTTPTTGHWEWQVNTADNNWITDQWQQNNMVITSGSGDDIVNPWGSGRVNVLVGAGNDVVYSDNSGLDKDSALTPDTVVNGAGTIWVINAKTDLAQVDVDGLGQIVPYQNNFVSNGISTFSTDSALQVADGRTATITVQVAYQGIVGTASQTLNMQIDPQNSAQGNFSISSHDVNNLIKDAVNIDTLPYAKLHTLLSAQEGAGESLMLVSKIDGTHMKDDVSITFSVKQGTGVDRPDVTLTGLDAYALTSGTNVQLATLPDGSSVGGSASGAYANNIINLGPGEDVAVLSSSAFAHETIVLNDGNNGHDYVVRFNLTGAGQDALDVTNILGGQAATDVKGTFSDVEAPLTAGTATATARQICFIQNDGTNADRGADYIASAADLLAAINEDSTDNPVYNNTLYMLYDLNADATFTMYKAAFDANGNCTVTDQGMISFYDNEHVGGADIWTASDFADAAIDAQLGKWGFNGEDLPSA